MSFFISIHYIEQDSNGIPLHFVVIVVYTFMCCCCCCCYCCSVSHYTLLPPVGASQGENVGGLTFEISGSHKNEEQQPPILIVKIL